MKDGEPNHFSVHVNLTQHCKLTVLQLKNKRRKKKHRIHLVLCYLEFLLFQLKRSGLWAALLYLTVASALLWAQKRVVVVVVE